MNSKKIVFITGLLSQPRCIKRIESIANAGYIVKVYGYNRGKYDCNVYSREIPITVLGNLKDGSNYFNKFRIFFRDISKIINDNKELNTYFYAFGFIQALILYTKRVDYFYEISDLLYAYPKFNLVFHLFKSIDKIIINHSCGCILTSKGFADFLRLDTSLDNIVLLPNKTNSIFENYKRKPLCKSSTNYSFGFVGAVRYKTILNFAKIIGAYYPNHQFHFFGGSNKEIEDDCLNLSKLYSNIYYHGSFKNPDDLVNIYSKIDIVVACYDTVSLNERLAEPNKLYEAILFCKPIIVSKGIFLSKRVLEYQCGFSVDASNENTVRNLIDSMNVDVINEISQKEYQYDKSIFLDNPQKLIALLNNL